VTAEVDASAAGTGSASDWMSAAVGIGDRLITEAIWSGDRCNWVGAEPTDLRNRTAAGIACVHRALGPGLYGGSGGVALFLAQLSATTGEDRFRPTALAAMRHAISRRDDIDPSARLGFYAGWAGLAAAALRTGLLLYSEEFVDAGTDLFREVCRLVEETEEGEETDAASPDGLEFDLISGTAGSVPALVLGHRHTGDDRMAVAAARAAGWLLRSARKTRTGWSWRSPNFRHQRDLTGLSHGAAGVAVALVQAVRLTGEEAFAAGARNAMRYENRWLSVEEGNWQDFRRHTDDPRGRVFSSLWCNGAPGIALSRLYAYEQLGEPQWRQDAMMALATTERVTRLLMEGGGADYSLCHGLPGNAESFQLAGVVLGADAIGLDIPGLVADHGLERNAQTGTWPCGTHSDESPGLLLGLAGIGYFYLRLAAPQLPSVLLPVRWGQSDGLPNPKIKIYRAG
jgi:lantibiotic modifying enzyme